MAEITGVLFKILSLGGKLCKVLPREILGHACQKKKKRNFRFSEIVSDAI